MTVDSSASIASVGAASDPQLSSTRSRFVLVPSKMEASRIVPIPGAEKLTLTLKQMFGRFAPSNERCAKEKVVSLRPGCYFGLYKDETGVVRNFTIFVPSRDNKVDWLLRKQPQLPGRILELYEVETALLDAEVSRVSSDEKNAKP